MTSTVKSFNVTTINARSILSCSRIYPYTINPYRGCAHACKYCYAVFMKRFSGHREKWGDFVDVKVNAAEVLSREIKKKPRGRVWISGVCDPYQPLEEAYRLTRRCLEVLVTQGWEFVIQTKSPLALRDLDVLKGYPYGEVCYSIATADEEIRKIFEPQAPAIKERIAALDRWHEAGIKTAVMIAPLLPSAENLVEKLLGKVDYVLIDRMNYRYADSIYRKYGLTWAKREEFFFATARKIREGFLRHEVPCDILF